METVVVTDGDERASLAIVRSLGAAGYRVFVTSRSGRSIAGGSRYCVREACVPDALDAPREHVERLGSLAREVHADLLIPVTESALLAVLGDRSAFEGVVIPFADLDAFQRVSDKRVVLEAAGRLGIADPTLAVAQSPHELEEVSASWDGSIYPVVVKPSRSVVSDDRGRRKTSVRYADDAAGLERIAEQVRHAFPVLVQRKVRGPGIGIFLLRWNGRVLATFAHRRLREKPPSGGVSVLRESIVPPGPLLDGAERLLAALDFDGVAMVEFKIDAHTEQPFLMEINGRFWGSLQLAIDAGVDFPLLLVNAAMGRPIPVPDRYAIGTRLRWTLGDLDHLILRLTRSKDELHLDPSAGGRLGATYDFARGFLPPIRQEVFRWGDLRPGVREIGSWLRALRGHA